jgi:hypothetical protein
MRAGLSNELIGLGDDETVTLAASIRLTIKRMEENTDGFSARGAI